MKIKESVVTIDLTFDEARDNFKLHQADMIHEIAVCELGNSPDALARSQFMLDLLKTSEHSNWFQDLVEKHNIHWVTTPANDMDMIVLIEQFPNMFGIGEVIERYETNNFDENNFEIRLDGVKLDTETILNNY